MSKAKQQTTRLEDSEGDNEHGAIFRTEAPEDVEEILRRAALYCRATWRGETVAAELEEAADYVAEEMLDE